MVAGRKLRVLSRLIGLRYHAGDTGHAAGQLSAALGGHVLLTCSAQHLLSQEKVLESKHVNTCLRFLPSCLTARLPACLSAGFRSFIGCGRSQQQQWQQHQQDEYRKRHGTDEWLCCMH